MAGIEQRCTRCHRFVYPVDRVGPLKDRTHVFHRHCFKCALCSSALTLRTYFTNQLQRDDREVYCQSHAPSAGAGNFDADSILIRSGMQRRDETRHIAVNGDANARDPRDNIHEGAHFDAGALHISHALHATAVQRTARNVDAPNNPPLYKFLDVEVQTELELQHRHEEDQMHRKFKEQLAKEETIINAEFHQEFETAVNELAARYDAEVRKKHGDLPPLQQKALTLRRIQTAQVDIEKKLTLRRDKKRDLLMKQILDEERNMTAQLVDKQSREMLGLIHQKRQEYVATTTSGSTKTEDGDKNYIIPKQNGADTGIAQSSSSLLSPSTASSHTTHDSSNDSPPSAASSSAGSSSRRSGCSGGSSGCAVKQQQTSTTTTTTTTTTKNGSRSTAAQSKHNNLAAMFNNNPIIPPKISSSKNHHGNASRSKSVAPAPPPLPPTSNGDVHHHHHNSKHVHRHHHHHHDQVINSLSLIHNGSGGAGAYGGAGDTLSSYRGSTISIPPPMGGLITSHSGFLQKNGSHISSNGDDLMLQQAVNAAAAAAAAAAVAASYPLSPPPPTPPLFAKAHIYRDPLVFEHIDQVAINVAQEDQRSFTDLIRQLTSHCSDDVERARAIFRWITVKNLNLLEFEKNLNPDSPMGLLQGIKNGTESYHVLFKRLCSYAGLHCVVVKGYSKSAGYQPGMRFTDSKFRNSWNAVFVDGAWRFVQCNWGARHLVNAREAQTPKVLSSRNGVKSNSNGVVTTSNGHGKFDVTNAGKSDSLRYEYDDHYFMTDPEEFIYEFYPLQNEWQLLKRPVTLQEFEALPFVRSLFFRYGLWFPDESTKAVIVTDMSGAATVRINMPTEMAHRLIFHYNLKLQHCEGDSMDDGVQLKRFVMQSVVGNSVVFRVHAPAAGDYLLDVFANAVTPKEYLAGEPMKFKSVCKFRIACPKLETVMVPLPMCASGEWGPAKAIRLFGLYPLTHEEALIFATREFEIKLRMTRPLTDFMANLHRNNADEKRLQKYVHVRVQGENVLISLQLPEDGQYGLDLYTREQDDQELLIMNGRKQRQDQRNGGDSKAENGGSAAVRENNSSDDQSSGADSHKQLLTHCCKYLINVSTKRTPV